MSSWVQAYIDQGKAEGEAKGEAKGKAEGRREMLLRQLRRRFGEVRGDIAERIQAANIDQLDDWSERFVDAMTFEDIFGADRRH